MVAFSVVCVTKVELSVILPLSASTCGMCFLLTNPHLVMCSCLTPTLCVTSL